MCPLNTLTGCNSYMSNMSTLLTTFAWNVPCTHHSPRLLDCVMVQH